MLEPNIYNDKPIRYFWVRFNTPLHVLQSFLFSSIVCFLNKYNFNYK